MVKIDRLGRGLDDKEKALGSPKFSRQPVRRSAAGHHRRPADAFSVNVHLKAHPPGLGSFVHPAKRFEAQRIAEKVDIKITSGVRSYSVPVCDTSHTKRTSVDAPVFMRRPPFLPH
jgi:hypothetical protein